MSAPVPSQARAVIIGGGVAGCSVAYHLAKLGWKDVVLLERKQLTSGTTWHAAGLLSQSRPSPALQRITMYSTDLYERIEAETGVATGLKRSGSLFAALSDGNREWAGAATLLVAVLANPEHDFEAPNRDGSTRVLWPLHAGIAVGNLLAQATALGLVAHPMAGFDETAVREALRVPGGVRVATVVAVGSPGEVADLVSDLQARESAPRKRLAIENLVAVDRWDERQGVSARSLREKR